jgi:hypothetical protein
MIDTTAASRLAERHLHVAVTLLIDYVTTVYIIWETMGFAVGAANHLTSNSGDFYVRRADTPKQVM